jgi:cytidyltransferase-like protein
MDGVFDLFHIGHLEAIRQCAQLGNRVIIGVTGDDDATGYKRRPVVPERERAAIVESLSLVDHVVCPCPLIVTEDFLDRHGIDLVVHGFANDADAERQRDFFATPVKLGKFRRIPYYDGLSTTDRLQSIRRGTTGETDGDDDDHHDDDNRTVSKPQWFGSSLAAATRNASTVPTDPFPIRLRVTIEPHIHKARIRRQRALDAVRRATGDATYDQTMKVFRDTLAGEHNFRLSEHDQRRLLSGLLESLGLPPGTVLERIHERQGGKAKDELLLALTRNPTPFQEAYDAFVRDVCVPRFAALTGRPEACTEVYYQSFPCVRIIQPDEFSIGPHADVSYGHHPCSVNFYIPLTTIGGTSSLFLESRPGAEDWHPIEGGLGKDGGWGGVRSYFLNVTSRKNKR